MGAFNFGNNYLTKHSYQMMEDNEGEIQDYDWIGMVIDELKTNLFEEIYELGELRFPISRTVEVVVTIDEITTESGYYSGVRFHPSFNVEYDFNGSKIPKWKKLIHEEEEIYDETRYFADELEQMQVDDNWKTFEEVLIGYLKSHLNMPINKKFIPKAEKKIYKYFEKVNDIFNDKLTPYTTGWCASPVAEEDR